MNRILVIGNGFDIAHGLPTSYSDFLYACRKLCGYETDDNGVSENLKEATEKFIEKFKSNNIMIDMVQKNAFICYYFKIQSIIGNTWIDFENQIQNLCEYIANPVTRLSPNSHYSCFKKDGAYSVPFIKNEFINLIKVFNEYLLIVNDLDINEYYQEILDFFPTSVISFNYTDTFKRIYNSKINYDYIHGKIDQYNNSIVLGFEGMKSEFNDITFSNFIKYIQMVEKDISIESYINLQKSSKNISLFFGHSFDKKDADIIKTIINNSEKVFILYHDLDTKMKIIKNLISIFGKELFINLTASKEKKLVFIAQSNSKNNNINLLPKYFDLLESEFNCSYAKNNNVKEIVELDILNKFDIGCIPLFKLTNLLYNNQNEVLLINDILKIKKRIVEIFNQDNLDCNEIKSCYYQEIKNEINRYKRELKEIAA